MNPGTPALWAALLARVQAHCTPLQFDTWFSQTCLLPSAPNHLRVGCPNLYVAQALEQHYYELLHDIATSLVDNLVELSFVVVVDDEDGDAARESDEATVPAHATARGADAVSTSVPANSAEQRVRSRHSPRHTPPPAPYPVAPRPREKTTTQRIRFADNAPSYTPGATAPPHANQQLAREMGLWESVPLNPDYRFERFVVGRSNRLAYAAAMAVAEDPGQTYNPLFLYGSVGLGKSHLLQGIAHRVIEGTPTKRLLYISCETFITHYVKAVEQKDLSSFQRLYRQLDILIIDDIHFLARKGGTQEEFFHTFNALYNEQKQIVISADSPPELIPELEQRLVSRFKMGLATMLEPPAFEMRVALFRQKAAERGLELADDVLHFLAEHITNNVREIEGTVKLLDAHVELLGRSLTLADVRQALRDQLTTQNLPGAITMERIVAVVSEHFNAKLAELQSKKRTKSITTPRQICMYFAKRHTKKTLEEIGGYFGGRDHSTVIHAIDKIKGVVETDPDQASVIERLEARIIGAS